MKINKSCFVLVMMLSSILLFSCKKVVYNRLSEEDIKWLHYLEGDIFVFSRSASVKDTFIITSRDRGYEVNKPYYNEAATVNFSNPNDTIGGNKNGFINVKKDDDDKFIATIAFPHFPKQAILSDMIPVPLDTVNGLPYTDVYIAVADTLTNSVNNYIKKIYYTKADGFIKLEDMFGNPWYKIN